MTCIEKRRIQDLQSYLDLPTSVQTLPPVHVYVLHNSLFARFIQLDHIICIPHVVFCLHWSVVVGPTTIQTTLTTTSKTQPTFTTTNRVKAAKHCHPYHIALNYRGT